ncbi:MAG: arsenic transporter [Bacillaceae bacterium]
METIKILVPYIVFFCVLLLIYWRPKGLNEAYPSTIGAFIIILFGVVSFQDLIDINGKIGEPSLTILSAIITSIVLESFGIFKWSAQVISHYIKGSPKKLFIFVNLFCIAITFLFNNDGAILITTPILIFLLRGFKLKPHQQLPYLISGALIATASSLPIGVSNIVNLISLKVLGIDLYMHAIMIFIPGLLGTLFLIGMLYLASAKALPKTLPNWTAYSSNLSQEQTGPLFTKEDISRFIKIIVFIIATRVSLYVASYFHIPFEYVAVGTAVLLLLYRWKHLKMGIGDLFFKIPWHVILFAYTMYIIMFGLKNAGLTDLIVTFTEPFTSTQSLGNTTIIAFLTTILSNVFNNHPALMISTLTLTQLDLSVLQLKLLYTASLIGSDMGALLLPIGTLATLLWMDILKRNKVKIKWKDYMAVTIKVIPISVLFTVLVLYGWMIFVRNVFHLW